METGRLSCLLHTAWCRARDPFRFQATASLVGFLHAVSRSCRQVLLMFIMVESVCMHLLVQLHLLLLLCLPTGACKQRGWVKGGPSVAGGVFAGGWNDVRLSQDESIHSVLWLGDCLRAGNSLAEGQWPPVHLAIQQQLHIPFWALGLRMLPGQSVRSSPPEASCSHCRCKAAWLPAHLAAVSCAAPSCSPPALAPAHTAVQLLAECVMPAGPASLFCAHNGRGSVRV